MNESSSNDTITTDRFYDQDYATFNYIMIGISCSVLLVLVVIARILCVCNKGNEYDQRQLLAKQQNSIKKFVPPSLQPQTKMKAETAGHSTKGHHIPGAVSPEANHRYRSSSMGRPMSGFSGNMSRVHGIWHTNSIEARGDEYPRLDKITNTSPDRNRSITSTNITSDPNPQGKDQSLTHTRRKLDPIREQEVLQENITDFLHQLETMV